MDTVEVSVLKYKFQFRPMRWREELSIKPAEKVDRRRQLLAHALVAVSGYQVKSVEDAMRIFTAIPLTVVSRIFIIYKGTIPKDRIFHTMGLYKAPEPLRFARQIEEAERAREEETFQKVENMMEQKFGREEMEGARELQEAIRKGSGMRGATKASPERIAPPEDGNANPSR